MVRTDDFLLSRPKSIELTVRLNRADLPADWTCGEAVAIDTETLGLSVGRDRLCVVQLSRGDGDADVVQIAAGQTSAPNLGGCSPTRKSSSCFISAASTSACSIMPSACMAAPVYCTKIASKLARTYTDRHGLKDLTRELLGVEISKQQQSSDWGARGAERRPARLCRLRRAAPARLAREARRDAGARRPGRPRPRRLRLSARSGAPRSRGFRGDGRFFARLSLS